MEPESRDIEGAQLRKKMGREREVGLGADEGLFPEKERLENIYGIKRKNQEGDVQREGIEVPEKL